MLDLSLAQYHPLSEMMLDVLKKKTQKENDEFFRIQIAYYLGKVASMMRCEVQSSTSRTVPVNVYAINLAPSGAGKGHSTSIIENEFIAGFKSEFVNVVFEQVKDLNMARIALDRSYKTGVDQDKILEGLKREFQTTGGKMVFSADSGTPAAIKQFRHMLLLAGAGSICLEIDEIGSTLTSNSDIITTFLDLYDKGTTKNKLVKNTTENQRFQEIDGSTPTNTLWFGTPAKLLDAGKTEELLIDFLETGYARRCIFGYIRNSKRMANMTAQQIVSMLNDPQLAHDTSFIHDHLQSIAVMSNFGKTITLPPNVESLLIEYKNLCEEAADKLKEHEEIRKSEVSHRYFRVLKLSAIYAFIDGSPEVTEDNLYAAIKLTEDSGEAFKRILSREKPYVKLARYIADVGVPVTQADLVEDLPCYRGTVQAKQELMSFAIAYGYKNNIIIKRHFESGIEFFTGESIKETDLNKMIISYSKDIATGYISKEVKFFGDMKKLLSQTVFGHFINHALTNGHRTEDSVIEGFNMLILDVDGTAKMSTVQMLLKEYMHIIYTTKSHGLNGEDRFRVILPMSHTLKMDANEFKEFMSNIYEWLPFEVDTQTAQRSRKWRTWNGTLIENQSGEVFNVLPFIPKTTQNEERKKVMVDLTGFSNLERWFITKTGLGNRNSQLIKFALLCVDQGYDYQATFSAVKQLNSKLQDPVSDKEILDTIMVTAGKKIAERGQNE